MDIEKEAARQVSIHGSAKKAAEFVTEMSQGNVVIRSRVAMQPVIAMLREWDRLDAANKARV